MTLWEFDTCLQEVKTINKLVRIVPKIVFSDIFFILLGLKNCDSVVRNKFSIPITRKSEKKRISLR